MPEERLTLKQIALMVQQNQETSVESQRLLIEKLTEDKAERSDEGKKAREKRKSQSAFMKTLVGLKNAIVKPVVDTSKSFLQKLKEALLMTLGMAAVQEFMEWWQGGGGDKVKKVITSIVDTLAWMANGLMKVWKGYKEGGLMGAIKALFENLGATIAGVTTVLLGLSMVFAPGSTLRLAIKALGMSVRGLRRAARSLLGMALRKGKLTAAAAGVGALMYASSAGADESSLSLFPDEDPAEIVMSEADQVELNEIYNSYPQLTEMNSGQGVSLQTARFAQSNPDQIQNLVSYAKEAGTYGTPQKSTIAQTTGNRNITSGSSLSSQSSSTQASSIPTSGMSNFDFSNTSNEQLNTSIESIAPQMASLVEEINQNPEQQKLQQLKELKGQLEAMLMEQANRNNTVVATQTNGTEQQANIMTTQTRGPY